MEFAIIQNPVLAVLVDLLAVIGWFSIGYFLSKLCYGPNDRSLWNWKNILIMSLGSLHLFPLFLWLISTDPCFD